MDTCQNSRWYLIDGWVRTSTLLQLRTTIRTKIILSAFPQDKPAWGCSWYRRERSDRVVYWWCADILHHDIHQSSHRRIGPFSDQRTFHVHWMRAGKCLDECSQLSVHSVHSRLLYNLYLWCAFTGNKRLVNCLIPCATSSSSIFSPLKTRLLFSSWVRPCKKCNQPTTDASNMMSSWVVLDSRTYTQRVQTLTFISLFIHHQEKYQNHDSAWAGWLLLII